LDEMKRAVDIGGEKYFEDYDKRMAEMEDYIDDDNSEADNNSEDDDNNSEADKKSEDDNEYCQECSN